MLYISRYIDEGRYGVVDTDDGVETIVNWNILEDCFSQGLKIYGVDRTQGSVIPYQVSGSRLQAKTKAMLGIDVRSYNGEITYVALPRGKDANNRIRLSAYGNKLSLNADNWCSDMWMNTVFVFDDKIELGNCVNLYGPPFEGGIFDLSECRNSKLVKAMYEFLLSEAGFGFGCYVNDINERLTFWKYVSALDQFPSDDICMDGIEAYEIPIGDMFVDDLKAIDDIDVFPALRSPAIMRQIAYFDVLFLEGAVRDKDYEALKSLSIDIKSFAKMLYGGTVSEPISRLVRYINYFKAKPKYRQAYMNLCEKFAIYMTAEDR